MLKLFKDKMKIKQQRFSSRQNFASSMDRSNLRMTKDMKESSSRFPSSRNSFERTPVHHSKDAKKEHGTGSLASPLASLNANSKLGILKSKAAIAHKQPVLDE